jgi:hypothetical protein
MVIRQPWQVGLFCTEYKPVWQIHLLLLMVRSCTLSHVQQTKGPLHVRHVASQADCIFVVHTLTTLIDSCVIESLGAYALGIFEKP